MTVNAYAASTTFEMRKKAVSLLGIITTSNYQANVTRGEFAELLVKASDYKEAATRREPYLYSWMSPQNPSILRRSARRRRTPGCPVISRKL